MCFELLKRQVWIGFNFMKLIDKIIYIEKSEYINFGCTQKYCISNICFRQGNKQTKLFKKKI